MGKACAPRSNRSGNALSPYAKHKKRPFDYTPMYRAILDKDPDGEFAAHLRARRSVG